VLKYRITRYFPLVETDATVAHECSNCGRSKYVFIAFGLHKSLSMIW
jgi:hypothetical protein